MIIMKIIINDNINEEMMINSNDDINEEIMIINEIVMINDINDNDND